MRLAAALLFFVCLTACKRAPDNAAIRQGVIDRLSNAGLNVAAMDVNVQSLDVKGNEADVTVAITLKAAPQAPPTTMRYRMQQQGSKWVVIARHDDAVSPHGAGGVAPSAASPHSGAGSEGSRMPSPEDLPPAAKKK